MKNLLIGAVGLVAMATSASAADMAARPYRQAPPPYVEPMYNWTGFYIGINGGWGQSTREFEYWNFERSHDASGGTVGGQIGYNWQAGSWVFGLEAQGNWADIGNSFVDPLDPRYSFGSTIDTIGLFTGRVGFAANNVLFYVKGGAAAVSNEHWVAYNNFDIANAKNTSWGATVGAGLEWGISPNWSFGVEYNHIFLGNHDNVFGNNWYHGTNSSWNNVNVRQDVDLVTLRLNYRFGGVGKNPVVARY